LRFDSREAHLKTLSTRQLAVLALSVAVLLSALLMNIEPEWKLLALSLLAGIGVGIAMFWRNKSGETIPDSATGKLASINISSIPIRGGIGAGILIAILLGAVLIDLPILRWIALPGLLGGLAFGGLLILWREH
jgi:MFS family permease